MQQKKQRNISFIKFVIVTICCRNLPLLHSARFKLQYVQQQHDHKVVTSSSDGRYLDDDGHNGSIKKDGSRTGGLTILCVSLRGGAMEVDTPVVEGFKKKEIISKDGHSNLQVTGGSLSETDFTEDHEESLSNNVTSVNGEVSNTTMTEEKSFNETKTYSKRKRSIRFLGKQRKPHNNEPKGQKPKKSIKNSYKNSNNNPASSYFTNNYPNYTFPPLQIGEKISNWKNETSVRAKHLFLDKISVAAAALLKSEEQLEEEDDDDTNDAEITKQSDLMRPGRQMFVVTTAAIPWFTGTAVNPMLRAAYLFRVTKNINEEYALTNRFNTTATSNIISVPNHQKVNNKTDSVQNIASMQSQASNLEDDKGPIRMVTLVIPWLELEEDRIELYGTQHNFTTQEDQELYIRSWLREEAEMPEEADPETGLKIIFYPARYHTGLKSIFAMGDISSLIPKNDTEDNDTVCILEEPEHLNWYRAPGDGWTKKFNFVVGIIHTNYVEYASSHYSGLWTAPAIRAMSSAMVRAYCHVVIKLSDTLQDFAEEKEVTSNVHGVRSEFLKEGRSRAEKYMAAFGNQTDDSVKEKSSKTKHISRDMICRRDESENGEKSVESSTRKAYFIGKILWAKGLDKMLEMQTFYEKCTGNYFPIDIYGNGPEEVEIARAFHGRKMFRSNSKEEEDITDSSSDEEEERKYTNDDLEGSSNMSVDEAKSFSEQISRISERIKSTKETIKSTTEALEIDFPKSRFEWRKKPIPASFPGRVDHAILKEYSVFVNPSISEVLCTTTAEALAMGKFVIIPIHPSNTFFLQFPNCLGYRNKLEFSANLHWAMTHEPSPLSSEEQRIFSWEAATDRLIQASAITHRDAKKRQKLGTSKLDDRIAWFHNEIGKGAMGDTVRRVLGGGPVSDQVAYEMKKRDNMINEASFAESDNDEGLTKKFVRSSLADAIRKTFANGVMPSPT